MTRRARGKRAHVPTPGRAAGRRGPALCGRWATYPSGDHDLLRRLARQAMASGDVSGYCLRCVARLTSY